ncbi:MAG TPA: hypothetical protein VNA14_01030 [Mycobacteriales bacterium]|nr:hypothetical protein [Mycobacteriales bacterium]
MNAVVEVRLHRIPIRTHARAQEHNEELTREFQLIVDRARSAEPSVPHRLVELSTTLTARYAGMTEEQEETVDRAIREGLPMLEELVFQVPRHAGEAAELLGRMLDEADEYCRQGEHLLTLATPPDLVAYRRWYLNEFVAQAAGLPPTPWPGGL